MTAEQKLSKVQQALVEAAQAAYPDGEDFIREDSEGDGLARFIYHEICDACVEAGSVAEAAQQAVSMMERAIAELKAVRDGMLDLV